MKRYLLTIVCLLAGFALRSQSVYTCQYWFDEDDGQAVTTTFGGDIWQAAIDVGSLPDGVHTLHFHVADTSMAWSSPQSFLFFKLTPIPEVSDVVCHYWFDHDAAAMQSYPLGNGMFPLNVDGLADGIHTLHVMIEGNDFASTQSFLFIKLTPELPITQVQYHYWFDWDEANMQSGTFGNGLMQLDVNDLEEGVHTLHVMMEGNEYGATQSFLFFKKEIEAPSDELTYFYWFDDNDANIWNGTLGDGILPMDVNGLEEGEHVLNIVIEGNNMTATQSFEFTKLLPSPCPYPDNLMSTVNYTSVVLSWDCEGENFRLCYYSQTNPTPVYENVAGHSVELTDLEPDNYYWQVQNLCSPSDTGLFVTGPSFTILEPIIYAVTASANPTDGGVVSGSGLYREGMICTLSAVANYGYTFINWTKNGEEVSNNPTFSFTVTEDANYTAHFYRASVNYYVIVSADPSEGGIITGSGAYNYGNYCTLTATPNEGWFFNNWTKNGVQVSNNPTYSFTITENAVFVANFSQGLPELHVSNIAHSNLAGGQQATISWTVQNDGTASTPNGAMWNDRVWLSMENRVAADDNNPILLGTFENISALNVGEYYTQTQTVNIPVEVSGEYFLFVLTDAYDCHTIFWNSTGMALPYNPPPYIGCLSHHCPSGCPNAADNRIYELSEFEHGDQPGDYYNDNFFYTFVDIAVPLVPDLQVTSIITPDNFFSGSSVEVTATISNLGEVTTFGSDWTDALYLSTEPDFNSAICLSTVLHSGVLQVDSTYQVTFTGNIPFDVYGEAFFFVKTDCYGQMYEHVFNQNNVMMSDAVNIILTPPADLEPSELVVPVAVSSAENLAYSFKVTNVGAGNPNVSGWKDRVYLCQNADTLDDTAILLKTISHYGGLQPGMSYIINESDALPSSVTSGFYYLYVVSDSDNDVFEYLFESNNRAQSSVISITSPDLQITEMTAPEQIVSGYPINLTYTIINNGDGAIINRSITDRIFLSESGNMNNAFEIANTRHNVNLPVGQSMIVTCNATAPTGLADGTFHLIVVADGNNEIHEANEDNNSSSHYPMPVMHQPLVDLQPVSLALPEIIQAGDEVTVEFDITNNGDLDLLNSNCTFNVYATWNGYEIFCPMQSQTLPLGSNVSIGIGQTVHFVRSIFVPASVTSVCTSFKLYADKENRVTESDENNNTIMANTTVLDCPLPDLVITNIGVAELQAGKETQITFVVNNNGTADFEGSFNTTVYVRSAMDTIFCPLVLQVSPTGNSNTIPVGGMLSFMQKVLIPPMASVSYNYFDVIVDEENLVLESNDDNNVTTISATVINYPFDLKTMTLQVPESVWAGESTSLTWTVKNIGICPSDEIPMYVKNNGTYTLVEDEMLPLPWLDKVYVSNDAVLSEDDIEVCSVARQTVLQPNGTYSVERSVTLPYSHLGDQFLLCVSDASRVTYDSDTLNNIQSVPIDVQLGSLPDLRITSLTVEENMTCDRAYWVHYTVVNEGERVTQKENWTDAFFIGENMTYIGALQLGAKIHHGALEVGETYADSVEILIPNGLNGDYFLIGCTDKTNQIYEHNNENDNFLAIPVTVLAPSPCDLIALQPEFPASVVSGEEMTVSWQLRNIGQNPAIGRIRNAVYLSSDAAWSSDDVMLGYANTDIDLAANAQQACALSGMLTSVPEGNYYVIVKVNILNALNELSYENNICVSMLTTAVGYPTLVIGEQVDRSLSSDQYVYYKLEVGPEYEGQTLSCTLTTTEQQVANGLYLSHETVPTLSQYDFGQYVPYAQEIEILIPTLEQGDYYLLAKGSSQSGSPQQVSIATNIINFEILHIDADHGANTGSITTKITGAKFDSIMDFRLVQGDEYLPAEKVFFSNSTETYTTFDLAEMPLGTYALEAELPGGIITIKGDAFTIEEGLPAELVVNVVAPSSVRNGNTFPVIIEYGNIGTTDLNVSGFLVVSGNGHPIGFTSDELVEGLTELTFSTAENNSNPDVLRPGYRTSKAVLIKANSASNVRVIIYAIRKQY